MLAALALIAHLVSIGRANEQGFRRTFLTYLGLIAALDFVTPVLYMLQSPRPITVADAFLLTHRYTGWGHVLMAYSLSAGLLIGGLLVVLVHKKAK
jgi:hypothetical protein